MDVRIGAAPIAAKAEVLTAVAKAVVRHFLDVVVSVIERTAPFSCPSIAGTSLSAVSPDYTRNGGTALGAA